MDLGTVAVGTLSLGMGIWLIAAGQLFRAGRLRRLGSWYFERRLPFYLRNFPFAALPTGVTVLVLSLAFPLAMVDQLWAEFLMLGTVLLALVGFLVSIAVMVHPPRFLKPRWILKVEQSRISREREA